MNKETYPILPLRDIVVYPKMIVPLFVGREKSIKALQQAIDNDQNIVLATQKEAAVEDPKPEDIFKVGTLGTVVQLVRLPDGTVKVLVEGLERVKIDDFIMADGFMQVDVEILAEDNVHDVETEALSRAVLSQFEEYVKLSKKVPPEVLVEVVREVAMCAGNFGMVGGQALDLDAEGKQISEAELRKLHSGKTGAMFIAAVRGGAHLAGATNDQLLALTHFADLLGLAFQITDDILDVEGDPAEMGKSAGSDEKKHKSTYVSLYTLAGAKALAEKTVAEALECLDSFGEKAEPLRHITKMMCGRKS